MRYMEIEQLQRDKQKILINQHLNGSGDKNNASL